MTSKKEIIGNMIAVVSVVQAMSRDPATIDNQAQFNAQDPHIEGPERPPEKIKLESDSAARTAQEGGPKNPDPPPPVETQPVQGSASFGKPEGYSVEVSKDSSALSSQAANGPGELGVGNVGSDFAKMPPPAPAPEAQVAYEESKTR